MVNSVSLTFGFVKSIQISKPVRNLYFKFTNDQIETIKRSFKAN